MISEGMVTGAARKEAVVRYAPTATAIAGLKRSVMASIHTCPPLRASWRQSQSSHPSGHEFHHHDQGIKVAQDCAAELLGSTDLFQDHLDRCLRFALLPEVRQDHVWYSLAWQLSLRRCRGAIGVGF